MVNKFVRSKSTERCQDHQIIGLSLVPLPISTISGKLASLNTSFQSGTAAAAATVPATAATDAPAAPAASTATTRKKG